MYVCLCNAIKDTELEELARDGVRHAHDAYSALGVEVNCETCTDYVQAILDETSKTRQVA